MPARASAPPQKKEEPRASTGDRDVKRALVTGFALLAVSIPFGVTLEALHGLKVQADSLEAQAVALEAAPTRVQEA